MEISQDTLQCSECKTNTKLAGKLYTYSGTTATVSPTTYDKSNYRESDNLTGSNSSGVDQTDNIHD